jgi:hypothetical protein
MIPLPTNTTALELYNYADFLGHGWLLKAKHHATKKERML